MPRRRSHQQDDTPARARPLASVGENLPDEAPGPDRRPDLDDIEPIVERAAPAPAPPAATEVRHRHIEEWKTAAAPTADRNALYKGSDAGYENGEDNEDDFLTFCEGLNDGGSYVLYVIREPDPMFRRNPGQGYNRPCFGERERLGYMPFNADSLLTDLQMINKNSGGNFTIIAHTAAREYVGIWRGTIADPYTPPGASAPTTALTASDPGGLFAALRQQAELRKLLIDAGMIKASDGNASEISNDPKVRTAQLLLGDGNLLAQTMTSLTTSMTAAVAAAQREQNPTTADRIIDTIASNPKLQNRIGQTLDRILARVLPGDGDGDINYADDDEEETENETATEGNPMETETITPEAAQRDLIAYLINAAAENRAIDLSTDKVIAVYKTVDPDAYELLLAGLRNFPVKVVRTVITKTAEKYGFGALVKLVLLRPEGDQFLADLKASAKTVKGNNDQ